MLTLIICVQQPVVEFIRNTDQKMKQKGSLQVENLLN